jgi:hypothetical protein
MKSTSCLLFKGHLSFSNRRHQSKAIGWNPALCFGQELSLLRGASRPPFLLINYLYVFESFAVLARVLGVTIMAPIIVVIVKANILASLFRSKDRDSYNKPSAASIYL